MHNKEDVRMKNYNKPEINIELINTEDVVLSSFGAQDPHEVINPWGWGE